MQRFNDSGRIRILLAEDEPFLQKLVVQLLLKQADLQVDIAEHGAEAIELAAQTQYDLILMDIQMPLVTGLEAAQRIRHIPGYQHTPIIAITGNNSDEDQQRCKDAGMQDYITKTFSQTLLLSTLARWLKKT